MKKMIIISFVCGTFLVLVLTSCQSNKVTLPTATRMETLPGSPTKMPSLEATSTVTPTHSPTVSLTPIPSVTLTPTPTSTPTSTPRSLADSELLLTEENSGQIQELAQWGEGILLSQQVFLDGQVALIETAYDKRLLHGESLETLAIFKNVDKTLISADEKTLLVTYQGESDLDVWRLPEGELLTALEYPIEAPRYPPAYFSPSTYFSVSAMKFSRDESLLAAAFGNAEIVIWDTATWEQVAVLTSNISGRSQNLVFSRDGRYLASVEGRLVFWKLDDYSIMGYIPNPGYLGEDPFSSDSTYFLTGGGTKVLIWNTRELSLVRSFAGGVRWVNDVRFAPDEEYIIVNDFQVRRVWDGKRLDAEKEDAALVEWGLRGGTYSPPPIIETQALEQVGYYPPFQDASFTNAYQGLLAWGTINTQLFWFRLPEEKFTSVDLGTAAMNHAALSPDETTLAVCLESKDLALVNLNTGDVQRIPGCRPSGRLAFLPDGKLLRTNGQLVDIVELPSGTVTNTLRGHAALVNAIYVHPDGSKILTGTHKLDDYAEVFIWNTQPLLSRLAQFKVPDFTRGESRGVEAIAISPDGSQLVSSRQSGMLDAFHLPGEYQLWIARVGVVLAMGFSPDGSILATGDRQGNLALIETTRGKQVYPELAGVPAAMDNYPEFTFMDFDRLPQYYPLREVLFLPDGSGIYTVGEDGIVRFWGVPDIP